MAHLGTWVYNSNASLGDSVKAASVAIRNRAGVPWGTAVGSGWTATMQVRKAGDATLVGTVTASSFDGTDAVFALGLESALVPAAGQPGIDYEGLIFMTKPGLTGAVAADDNAEPYTFRVERWP